MIGVLAAPYWPDAPPANTNTSEGETVTFDCQANGKPVPVITFYKNGVGNRFHSIVPVSIKFAEMRRGEIPGNWYVLLVSFLYHFDLFEGRSMERDSRFTTSKRGSMESAITLSISAKLKTSMDICGPTSISIFWPLLRCCWKILVMLRQSMVDHSLLNADSFLLRLQTSPGTILAFWGMNTEPRLTHWELDA